MHIINRLGKQQCSLQSAIHVTIEFTLIFGETKKSTKFYSPQIKMPYGTYTYYSYIRRLSVCHLIYLEIQSITQLWYRFNATLHSHASNRTPLAKCSNSIEQLNLLMCLNSGSNSSSKENLERAVSKLKMIIRVVIVMNYKCPVINS